MQISVPLAIISVVLLLAFMPQRLQTEPAFLRREEALWRSGKWLQTLARIDVLGALLLLGACLLLSTGLEQATARISFAAPKILPLLIISGLMWLGFAAWQWFVTQKLPRPEPVLPWRLFNNRIFAGMLM